MAPASLFVGEDLAPFTERLIGRDQQGSAFIAGGDQLEQHAGLGLILGDVGDIVEDQQLVLVEFVDGGFKLQVPTRYLCPIGFDFSVFSWMSSWEISAIRKSLRDLDALSTAALAAFSQDSVLVPTSSMIL